MVKNEYPKSRISDFKARHFKKALPTVQLRARKSIFNFVKFIKRGVEVFFAKACKIYDGKCHLCLMDNFSHFPVFLKPSRISDIWFGLSFQKFLISGFCHTNTLLRNKEEVFSIQFNRGPINPIISTRKQSINSSEVLVK